MLIFNLLGAVMVIAGLAAGFAVGGLVSLLTRDELLPYAVANLVALPVPTVWDLVYRWRHDPDRGWLRYVMPLSGGMFMLVPVWVLFGAVPVVGVSVLIVRKQLGLD
jgi:hypothetical protein